MLYSVAIVEDWKHLNEEWKVENALNEYKDIYYYNSWNS